MRVTHDMIRPKDYQHVKTMHENVVLTSCGTLAGPAANVTGRLGIRIVKFCCCRASGALCKTMKCKKITKSTLCLHAMPRGMNCDDILACLGRRIYYILYCTLFGVVLRINGDAFYGFQCSAIVGRLKINACSSKLRVKRSSFLLTGLILINFFFFRRIGWMTTVKSIPCQLLLHLSIVSHSFLRINLQKKSL